MKFSSVACLLLPAVAQGAGIELVQQGLYNISNSTVQLTKSIAGFTLQNLFVLQAANAAAVDTINNAAAMIKAEVKGTLALNDAVTLTPIIDQLVSTVQKSVNTTIDQKRAFGGIAPVVRANLQQQLTASQQLNAVIGTKLPSSLLKISAQSSQPIYDSIDAGIAAFAKPFPNTPENSPEIFTNHVPQLPGDAKISAGVMSSAPSAVAALAAFGAAAFVYAL